MGLTEYEIRICEFLEKMPHNARYSIHKLATAETREKFIETVKLYMDSFPFQGYITFNQDYSEIYKTEKITFKKIN